MIRRRLLAALATVLALAGCGESPSLTGAPAGELTFSILKSEEQPAREALWRPLLADLSDALRVRVNASFATDYDAQVQAMRSGEAQAGWYVAPPALTAVDEAGAEVVARVIGAGGPDAYRSVLIVRKGRGLTLDDVLKCGRKLSFGIGDPASASGTLAPTTYLFAGRNIEPTRCFKTVRAANHQVNLFAVANGQVDVASNNTVGLEFARRETPALAQRVEVIWTSPPLPVSTILVRKDLDPAMKEKIRQFFITYGTGTGPVADRQRETLRRLAYSSFDPADDSYLDPMREMVAAQALADARKSGDKAKVAAARAHFEKVRAAAAQRRAADPDI